MSNKSKDLTAMRNARTWVNDRHPGALLIEASKKIMWIPDGKGGRFPRTKAEDVWGVFDLVAFPRSFGKNSWIDLIQVTTITDGSLSAVNTRKAKVGTWMRDNMKRNEGPPWLGNVYVIGWVSRRHFRVWEWHCRLTGETTWGGWTELDPQKVSPSSKPRSPKPAQSEPVTAAPPSERDFDPF